MRELNLVEGEWVAAAVTVSAPLEKERCATGALAGAGGDVGADMVIVMGPERKGRAAGAETGSRVTVGCEVEKLTAPVDIYFPFIFSVSERHSKFLNNNTENI